MRLSLGIPSLNMSDIARCAAAAEGAGFELLRVGDMQSTHRDAYAALALVAEHTSTCRVGPGVTNPITRHPAVTAASIASIDELSGGRAFLGIGAGDSAVRNLGLKPARLQSLKAYINAVRDLHLHGTASFDDRSIGMHWWNGKPIPIFVAAQGPRMLRLAGAVADGVIVGSGTSAIAVEYALENISLGAKEAGRQIEDIEVWFLNYVNIDSSYSEAVDAIASALAVAGNFLAHTTTPALVPDRLRAKFDELRQRYSYQHHFANSSEAPNARLIRELGLVDFLASNFALVGSASEVTDQMAQLETFGVTNAWLSYSPPDYEAFLGRWSQSRQLGDGLSR